jgi:septal ring factor EnvC (AmiA/AmiB activator)
MLPSVPSWGLNYEPQIFGWQRSKTDMLAKVVEQEAAIIDSAEKQVAALKQALASCERERDEAREQFAASLSRRADLRHQVDVLTGRIAELEGKS